MYYVRMYSEISEPFARRQHLFDIAATPIDVDSNFASHPVSLFLFQFAQKCNQLICWWRRWNKRSNKIK